MIQRRGATTRGNTDGKETGMGMDQFKTRDLYLAAALALIGETEPALELDRGGRVVFTFPQADWIPKTVAAYHGNDAVASLGEYVERVRGLKAKMFATREPGR